MSDTEQETNLPEVKNPRQLVENMFIEMGFPNENPADLDLITDILEIWMNPNIDETDYAYTPEQYILLNDPDVIECLSRCRSYYEPKRRLSQGEIQQILENIASGKLTRRTYDFKSHSYVTEEPSFNERLTAIKLLKDNTPDDNGIKAIQFVNNIAVPPSPTSSSTPSVLPHNTEAPKEPPPGHYSLKLEEGENNDTTED